MLAGTIPGRASIPALAGNANLHLDKTVSAATLSPVLALALAVDQSSAIPGDRLTYTATVSNTGASLVLSGDLTAENTDATAAAVSSYFDVVSTTSTGHCVSSISNRGHDTAEWAALAATAASQPGYVPVLAPPIAAGLSLMVTPIPSDGVTYPAAGDLILGTRLDPGATASWHYTASISLTPAQTAFLLDPAQVTRIRNTLHAEVGPRSQQGNGQPPMVDVEFCQQLLAASPSGTAGSVAVLVALPNGTAVRLPVGTLLPGTSTSVLTLYRVPVVGAKAQGESDADYLARLQAVEGLQLVASAVATGTSSAGTVTAGPTTASATTEHLPIITVAKSGPAKADAGTTHTYPLALQNGGGATASGLQVTDSVPSGDTGTVTGVPATLGPGAATTATATFAIPVGQAEGGLTDTASVSWTDANHNAYGPVSSNFTTQVSSTFAGSTLTLAPASAGPNLVGTTQGLTATLLDRHGAPMANQLVSLAISGANPLTATATTDANGVTSFVILGTNPGTDVAQATFMHGAFVLHSNTATVAWIKPVAVISTTPADGTFFAEPASACSVIAKPGDMAAFGQTFPTIDFNPPSGTVNHNISGVGPSTRPFTDVTTDQVGNFSGTIIAQGNGVQAGLGSLSSFDAVFTASLTITKPGDVTFGVVADDAFLLGIGGGATRVSGAYENAPASNTSPFKNYPLVGAWNQAAPPAGPATHAVTVHFPAAGSYPYELDYAECGGGTLSLTLTELTFTPDTSPLSLYVGYADGLRPAGSIFPFPWLGSPNVIFIGSGAPFDAGALRLDNNSDTPMTFDSITVDLPSQAHFDIWPHGQVLPAHQILILTQTAFFNFDTSDFSGCGGNDGVIPAVNVTQGGVTTTFKDTGQILNTFGFDLACRGNESQSWTRIGGGGAAINTPLPPAISLSLAPTTLPGATVGQTQRLIVTALDGSGQPVPSLAVTLGVFGANTQHVNGTTNSAGVVTLSYVGLNAGTDTIDAIAFISGLRAASNQLSLTWKIPVPPPPPPPPSGTSPPSISNLSPADGTSVAASTPVNASITPAPGSTIASWSVSDQLLPSGTSETLASGSGNPPAPLATFNPANRSSGTYAITISATSSAGGSAAAVTRVVVGSGGGTAAQAPPTIAPSTPADGTVVTGPLPVTASFTAPTGQSIASWSVTVTPAAGGASRTIGSATGTPPATLATLDPTLLPNGTYLVAVSGTASGGGTQTVTTTVSVAGQLKLGRYVSTYLDLNVPVSGFLMQVRRVFDSADKSNGDFGIGWHLSVSNFQVRSNRALGDGGWSEYPTSCVFGLCNYGFKSSAPHFVTVGFPDGHDEIFDFTPAGGSVLFYWEGTSGFTARAGLGITSTLAVAGDQSVIYGFDGNLYDSNFNLYNPTRFLLTTRDGRQILLDVNSVLLSETDRNGNTLSVDSGGLHSSTGSSITFTRDSQNRITAIAGPGGQQLAYTYSSAGDLGTYRDANGNAFTLTYDANHDLLGVTGPGSTRPLQQQVYDPNTGRLSQVIDGAGNVTQVTDDVANHTQTIVDPNGSLTTIETFDDLGDLVKQSQVFGGRTLTTTFTYDAVGHELSRTDPLGHTSSATYDASGNLTSTTDADGNTTTFQYDTFGQLIAASGPGGALLMQLTRDSRGNVLKVQRADGTSFSYTRDSTGRMTSITDPSGRTEHLTYDTAGHLSGTVDPAGNAASVQINSAGQVTGITDARPSTTSFTYDAAGNMTSITDGNGQSRRFTYDAFGHELSETDPLGQTRTYQYDAAGRLDSQTDRDGRQITYTYDVDGKLARMVMPGSDVATITYDPLRRPTSLTNGTATVQLQYDDAGRVTAQTSSGIAPIPTVTLQYAYDKLGLRTQLTGPEGSTSYRYDGLGRLTGITDPAQGSFTFGYSAASQLTTLARPNGVTDTLTFSGSDLISRIATQGPTVLGGVTYTYTVNGLRASATANGATGPTTYGYDVAGQLVSASTGGNTQTWAYDAGGNIVSSPTTPAGGYTYDAAERLAQDAQNTYTYDHEGDMLTRTNRATGAVTAYDWNARHQLLAIHLPDGSTERFAYDPLGRRVGVRDASGAHAFVYDGDAVDLEYDGAGNLVASYTNGLAQDDVLEMARGGHRYFYLKDGLNSTTGLANETGVVVTTYTYDAFGAPTASTGAVANPFTFTGREYDAHAGLLYLRARYYDPHLGRFLSEDPVLHPNPYPYVDNDPTNRRDPSGAQDLVEEEETLVVEGELEESALSEEAQMVRQFGQMHADLGKEHLLGYLRQGELEALQRAPWLERMYLGTAIHRAVAADLEALGFVYNTIGPDFAIGDLLIELTTPGAVAAHLARGGLYLIAEIVTYLLVL